MYREVWEPLLRLPRATMPLLWLTGPRDAHFPLEIQQASYRATPGPRLVSTPFDMKHGHPAGWEPPDSYAFARAVVETGRQPDGSVFVLFSPRTTHLDLRLLEPPEPMQRTLEAAAALAPRGRIVSRTRFRPVHLLEILAGQGLIATSTEQPDGTWGNVIVRASTPTPAKTSA